MMFEYLPHKISYKSVGTFFRGLCQLPTRMVCKMAVFISFPLIVVMRRIWKLSGLQIVYLRSPSENKRTHTHANKYNNQTNIFLTENHAWPRISTIYSPPHLPPLPSSLLRHDTPQFMPPVLAIVIAFVFVVAIAVFRIRKKKQ